MKITYFLVILLNFGYLDAEPCKPGLDHNNLTVLSCIYGLADSDFPLDASYHGSYDRVEIGMRGPEGNVNLTKIPAGGLSGISTSSLEIFGNLELVTIESGFFEGSEFHVEQIICRSNEILR